MATTAHMMGSIEERYAEVCRRVADAARRVGRAADSVLVVAVTKNADPEQIRALIELGHRDFGENRVQHLAQRAAMVSEFLTRIKVLPGGRREQVNAATESLFWGEPKATGPRLAGVHAVRWHMIGHLQRNKARKIVDVARLIHSVDSLRLAEELQQVALRRDTPIEVLVQVNCSGEESKFGCPVPAALPLAEQIDTMINVKLRGLMCMAPHTENPEEARPVFVRAREIFEEIRSAGYGEGRCNILSMGMTNDFEVAISEGANVVRIGTAIFGPPSTPDAPESEEPETES